MIINRSYFRSTQMIFRPYCSFLKGLLLSLLFASSTPFASDKTLLLYHDADWRGHPESSLSIWQGVQTALSEVNHKVQGYDIKIVKKNHSANVARSRQNLKEFLAQDNTLAIISGLHSSPLIKSREFINENNILTLVPWAAGAPITRYPNGTNWVFRTSIDDAQAGLFLVDYAINTKGCRSPHLLLENTAWGQSNKKSMTQALAKIGKQPPSITLFDWQMKSYSVRDKLLTIFQQNADCILMVANPNEGAAIIEAMADFSAEKHIPIISHWGITGGNFHEMVTHSLRKKVDLSFIQTCFSFIHPKLSAKSQQVFTKAKLLFPDIIKAPIDIKSPAGFIHGYDMTALLLAAMQQVTLTDNIADNRSAIRLALENIQHPVEGLMKTYHTPFSAYSQANPNAHEALSMSDYCMAIYGENNEIILLD